MRAIHKVAVLGAAVVAFGTVGVGTALADPFPALSAPPALTSIEGVGSDTITPLFSGNETSQTSGDVAQDYDATSPASLLYSWDAVSPSTGAAGDTITTKASGSGDSSCSFARPDGSSAGITDLNNTSLTDTFNGVTYDCIDFARSSRGPNTTSFKDAFAALATDAIAWSYPVISGQTNPQPASLTHAQLVSIYTCADTNWDQVGGTNAPIVPVIPQSGSGTRSTWLTQLGISSTTVEPCWVNGTAANGAVVEENTGLSSGNVDQFTGTGAQDDVFPYSIGDWIAQSTAVTGTGTAGTPGAATVGGHATSIWGHGNLTLGKTSNGITGEAAVTTNTTGQPVINPSFPAQFDRTLYDVVRNGTANPTGPTTVSWPTTPSYAATGLQAIFGPSGFLCKTNSPGQSDIVSYGFGLESSANCGSLTAGD